MDVKQLNIEDFSYELPDEKIAKFPLSQRNQSKLLVYENGIISQDTFFNIANYIPEHSLLIVNDSKVIPARLIFKNENNASIEIFCLEPANHVEHLHALQAKKSVEWICMIGNKKKWKQGSTLTRIINSIDNLYITAEIIDNECNKIKFYWNTENTFLEMLEQIGALPLPPYLKRETQESDKESYQTMYAKWLGSVAAPTAGLHFTSAEFDTLRKKKVEIESLCLHVGAGTFKPVKSKTKGEHEMHEEVFSISTALIEKIINQLKNNHPIIAVGTTTTRTLESLFYIAQNIEDKRNLSLEQWECYNHSAENTSIDSLLKLYNYLKNNNLDKFNSSTKIIIAPNFKYRIIDKLITNFHQPKSTLLLLIAAAVGQDWKKIYTYALSNNFRFLSYGDSSIISIENKFKGNKSF